MSNFVFIVSLRGGDDPVSVTVEGVKSALLCSQGDPPDLWQPPGDGVSLRVNPGRGGGGSIPGAGNKTWSNSKEDS
ncbi:hypothetical protein Bca52824_023668 [Brassica carinata]|uniref:Uncharacterized protein n=1 Tax=Brassica carinata TaxID=52824 RepID=A0A8X7VJ31_BRACI|nr:hypothetical protein Bca52824_023668 [Brassica carinata]